MRADVYPVTRAIRIRCSPDDDFDDMIDKLKQVMGEEHVHVHKYNR